LAKLDTEYQMVIHDWADTPISHIFMDDINTAKALTKYCNKTTLSRLGADLEERKEFEDRTMMRAKRQYLLSKACFPNPIPDSDSSGPEDKTDQEKINEIRRLHCMKVEERVE